MSKRIGIDIGLDASGVAKGAKDAERALGKLEDAVGDTGKGGARDLDKLEDELKDVQRQGEKTERSMKDIGDSSKRTWDAASDNVKGFKDEAVQNFAEVASSFDGDLSQMADGVQGLTGGLASALTPGIGIPVAILGAAAAAFFASWQKAAEDSEARIQAMYDDFTETGQTFVSESFIADEIKRIQEDTGKWNDAQQRVKDTGLEIGTVLRAMAGDQQAIADVHDAYVQQRDTEIQKIRDAKLSIEDQATAVDGVNAKFGEQTEWISQIQRDTGTAAQKAAAYRDAIGGASDRMRSVVEQWRNIPKSQQLQLNVSTNFDRVFNEMARKANQGIRVTLRADGSQGRAWE